MLNHKIKKKATKNRGCQPSLNFQTYNLSLTLEESYMKN